MQSRFILSARRCGFVANSASGGRLAIIIRGSPSICFKRNNSSSQAQQDLSVDGKKYPRDGWTNTPGSILSKIPKRLHHQPDHPLGVLRSLIEGHFSSYTAVSPASAVVTVAENFDELGFAPDHPGRSMTDSYYLNKDHMLRTHTSAHEVATFRAGHESWLLSADVYRRDEIDSSHYPVFHQMEGARVWEPKDLAELKELNARMKKELEACPLIIEDIQATSDSNPYQPEHDPEMAAEIAQNLKHSLNSLIFKLFGQARPGEVASKEEPLKIRWIEAFFPFTSPSYEVEVWWGGEWLEILGCGVIMQQTLKTAGVPQKAGWAFGLGLERIAMILFSIPDIRLFWSEDTRFTKQFKAGRISTFQPYSKYPPCIKDVSFWLPVPPEHGAKAAGGGGVARGGKAFHENDFCEIVRDVAGDLVENVQLIDEFTNKKTGRNSKCYRITYRSMDRSLSNEEVNKLQNEASLRLVDELDIELR